MRLKRHLILCALVLTTSSFATSTSTEALYKSINPTSISKLLAFYELYPDTKEGKEALRKAYSLVEKEETNLPHFPKLDLKPLISLVNKEPYSEPPNLEEEHLEFINKICKNFANRKLKTFGSWILEDFISYDPNEIDLARGLLLSHLGSEKAAKQKIRSYEASLDLMALQILAKLPSNPSGKDKIQAINDFVFFEMGFRFPPHSLHAKNIDTYTFLPSVMDTRRGVCLGVSILYLCLAQRIDLSLESITPPGHIFVRYKDPDGEIINIETTARGINIPSEKYLGIETRKLQTRTIKEVIGLAFINEASVLWNKNDFKTAVSLYEQAEPFLRDDYVLKQLLGYNYLFLGEKIKGEKLLSEIVDVIPDWGISKETIIEDYFANKTTIEAIKSIFLPVDEKRSSILAKQKKLLEITRQYPKFRAALLSLANSYLQLGREKEALSVLQDYDKIDATDPTVNYYLAVISHERYDYNSAWKHLKQTEEILQKKEHEPRVLSNFRQDLRKKCPEPKGNK